jgi:hypothetical protein
MNGNLMEPHYWGSYENDESHLYNKTMLSLEDGVTYILGNDEASQGEINYRGSYYSPSNKFQLDQVGSRHFMALADFQWWFDQKSMPDDYTKNAIVANVTSSCQDYFKGWTATVRAST